MGTDPEIYRVLFETVNQSALSKYCNADPVMFKNTTQMVPNSLIPDEDWHPVEGRATDNPWQQYNQLRLWEAEDREFIRNVRLQKMTSEPQWEEMPRELRRDVLLAELAARPEDPEFMSRMRHRIEADREILTRLAEQEADDA
jgi:hypothetical protein